MRNHLNVVKGGAEGLTDELEGEAREWASLIEEAAAELLETSEQARRIEQQIAGDSNPGRVDLAAIVRDEAERLRASYDCTVTVDVPDEAPGCVTIGFRDAVRAVLENAVEHNDTDHPTVEAAVVESLDGGYYDVRIADDGPGIPADEAQVVREPSQRSQTQHLDGLGLWTARWVLQNSGGDLEFSSNAPRGTVVPLRGPRSDADAGDGADGCETDAAADPDGPADPATAADEPPATD
jgi:signal transduction histidine kinase